MRTPPPDEPRGTLLDDRHQAADEFCWSVILRMHLGLTAEQILQDPVVLNAMQTWANLASAEGVLRDDDPEGKVVSHDVPSHHFSETAE